MELERVALSISGGFGDTAYFAKHVEEGAATVKGVQSETLTVAKAIAQMDRLSIYEGFILGTPTYMGTVSAPFKAFLDASSGPWMTQSWTGKTACGFTVSESPSRDK